MSESDPTQTTTFEVSAAGADAKVTTRRVSELVAILALVTLAVQTSFTYQLWQQVDALTVAMKAEVAGLSVAMKSDLAATNARQERFAEALREATCIQLSSDEERRSGAPRCKYLGRAP